jgi:DNA (cytosine-5)-methyltransferase 1
MGGGQKEMGREGSEFTNAIKANGKDETSSDTNNNGQHRYGSQNEKQSAYRRFDAQHDIDKMPSEGNVADTKSQRYQSFNEDRTAFISAQNESRLHGRSRYSFNKPCSWENFPTVSPICDGDDGLSNRLDNITFSKWRRESIKGGGNAVVPPLILQIFKTIEAYERITSTKEN